MSLSVLKGAIQIKCIMSHSLFTHKCCCWSLLHLKQECILSVMLTVGNFPEVLFSDGNWKYKLHSFFLAFSFFFSQKCQKYKDRSFHLLKQGGTQHSWEHVMSLPHSGAADTRPMSLLDMRRIKAQQRNLLLHY